jgi:O-antigen/teichoic acid export membrane protein
MRLATKVAYNTIMQIGGRVISLFLGLAAMAIITRYLGKFGFGQYTIATTFASFFAVLADFGLTLITAQLLAKPQAKPEKIVNNLLALRFFSAFIILGIAPLVVWFFPYDLQTKIGVGIASLSFLFVALNQILVGLFQKELRLGRVAIAELISKALLVVFIVGAVYWEAGLYGVLTASVVSTVINFLLHYYFSRSFFRVKFEFDFVLWKEVIYRTWPIALTITLNLIYLRADTFILSLFRGEEEVGLYGAAYRIVDVLTSLPFIFAGIIMPILTASWGEGNHAAFNRVMQKSFDLMALCVLPLVFGAQFTSRQIIGLMAGSQFGASAVILQILIFAVAFIFLGCIFAHALIAIDKQKKIIAAYFFVSLTALLGYLIFIPRYSYYGAAGVTLYSELAIALASYFYARKYSKFLPNFSVFIKALGASIVMGVFLYCLPSSLYSLKNTFLLAIPGAMAVYFFTLFVLGGLTREDFSILIAAKK